MSRKADPATARFRLRLRAITCTLSPPVYLEQERTILPPPGQPLKALQLVT